jgi:hypothetical protein
MNEDQDINNGFSLPPGYGDSLARRLAERVACLEEVREYRNLHDLKGSLPFSVPDGYFASTMEVEMVRHICALDLDSASTVPPGYFEENRDLLLLLSKITHRGGNELAFVTPPGYNKEAVAKITRTLDDGEGKILFLGRPTRWAMAALLTLIVGAWLFRVYRDPVETEDCGTLACIEKRDLLKSREIEVLNEEELLQLVDDEELENSLMEEKRNGHDSTPSPGAGKTEKGKG